jgi:glycerol-3-phosphate dehydrogenase
VSARGARWAALRDGGPFDLIVIGGGIAGAGVALEAARAGARIALVEARDFASGSSSGSSKLVHGGLRYLAQGRPALTLASVRARDALLADSDGLVQPLGFLMPVRDRRTQAKLGLGLMLYDRFAGHRSRAWLSPAEAAAAVPPLDCHGLRGAWSYLDAQTDDARLVLRLLAEAQTAGAQILNHAAVVALLRDGGRVTGVRVHDRIGNQQAELTASCVINAGGAGADALRAQAGHRPRLRPLRGSHLLFDSWRLPLAQAVAFFHPQDRRPVFALPWEGRSLVGTTDVDHRGDPFAAAISRAEHDYLLQALQLQFPSLSLGPDDVVASWSAVRPVVDSGRALAPSQEPREHLVLDEGGLITLVGGKLTTFRASARAALVRAARWLPGLRLASAATRTFRAVDAAAHAALVELPAPVRTRLLARFGADAAHVRQQAVDDELAWVPGTATLWAELRHACREEAVEHLDDLLLRRTRLGLLLRDGGAAILPRVRRIACAELGWNGERWEQEQARYRQLLALHHPALPAA